MIDNIGRKVLYCNGCKTANFDEPIVIHTVGKKEYKHCPYCTEKLTMRSKDRISNSTLGKAIGDYNSKSTWVVRTLPTPWGKLRLSVSTQSNQCYNAYFMPVLLDSGKRDVRGNMLQHVGRPIPTEIDSVWFYPASNASMIKELINDAFSNDAIYSAWKKLDGREVGQVEFSRFLDQLKDIITDVHATPNPTYEIDYEMVAL